MHGIVHKTLKEYVVAKTDDVTWATIVDRADIEQTLYLPVSSYADHEVDAILETLSSMATQNRRQIERDFGRTLTPELLTTFNAHIRDEWALFDLLEHLELVIDDVDTASDGTSLPAISCTRESAECVHVAYRTHRDPPYCGLAHGILEGVVNAFDTEATVTEVACVHDGEEECLFRVDQE